MGEINWKNKCWVTTIFLFKDDKILLTWNKNLQTWIPVGGHIEYGETPDEAIIREVKEEVNCDFEFFPRTINTKDVKTLKPFSVQIEKVPHHGHHINHVFFGKVTKWNDIKETDEQEIIKWFSREDIFKENILESVKNSALKALDLIDNTT